MAAKSDAIRLIDFHLSSHSHSNYSTAVAVVCSASVSENKELRLIVACAAFLLDRSIFAAPAAAAAFEADCRTCDKRRTSDAACKMCLTQQRITAATRGHRHLHMYRVSKYTFKQNASTIRDVSYTHLTLPTILRV